MIANEVIGPELQAKVGASDLVQDTFLEAQRHLAIFRGKTEGEMRAWLRKILECRLANVRRSYLVTEMRAANREVTLDPGMSNAGAGIESITCRAPSPSNHAVRNEWNKALEQALKRLPEHHRQAVAWRHQEQLSWDEIGRRMDCTADAARKVWSRAIQQLRRELAEHGSMRNERRCLASTWKTRWPTHLAAYDDRLAAGITRSTTELDEDVDPALLPDWNRLTAFLSLVEKAWPRGDNGKDDLTIADLGRGIEASPAESGSPGASAETVAPPAGDDRRFGRFQILRALGQGGFGIVFLAWDPALLRHVALKVPQPEIGGDTRVAQAVSARGTRRGRARSSQHRARLRERQRRPDQLYRRSLYSGTDPRLLAVASDSTSTQSRRRPAGRHARRGCRARARAGRTSPRSQAQQHPPPAPGVEHRARSPRQRSPGRLRAAYRGLQPGKTRRRARAGHQKRGAVWLASVHGARAGRGKACQDRASGRYLRIGMYPLRAVD